ncbi:Uncharacterized protein SCF082_LOCUS19417 [Durusdinium trenchii]
MLHVTRRHFTRVLVDLPHTVAFQNLSMLLLTLMALCLDLVPAQTPTWDVDGQNKACRHTKTWVVYEGYFGKHYCTETLEDCKAHCENTAGCKGVEFSAEWSWAGLGTGGRCEVWFVDINVTWPDYTKHQVTCLRYHNNPLQVKKLSFSEGLTGACRGASSTDTSVCYYSVHSTQPWQTAWYSRPKLTLEDCKKRCSSQANCTGIEFEEETGYCEAWKVPITATSDVPGYRCYRVEGTGTEATEPAVVYP